MLLISGQQFLPRAKHYIFPTIRAYDPFTTIRTAADITTGVGLDIVFGELQCGSTSATDSPLFDFYGRIDTDDLYSHELGTSGVNRTPDLFVMSEAL